MNNINHNLHRQTPIFADTDSQIQELIQNSRFQDLIHDLILGRL